MRKRQFPNDIRIKVIGKNSKMRTAWQSDHLVSVHEWMPSDVRVMQLTRKQEVSNVASN